MDIGNFLQNLFQPQTISSGVPSSGSYGSGQGMPPETDVLQRLLGGNPVNVMQQAGIDPNMPQPAPVAQQPQPAAQAPRPRRSLLETIGRISDVLATTGGATPLYEPTLDAREDRTRQQAMQDLQRRQAEQQIGAGDIDLSGKSNARAAQALLGLKAIQQGGGDVNAAWPLLAQQAGIPADQAAQLGQIFGTHPEALDGVIASLGGTQNDYGLNLVYGTDANGNVKAFQTSKSGQPHEFQFPEGFHAIDPLKFVDVGGGVAGVGTNSGGVKRIIPKTEAPGRAADRQSRERIAGMGNASRERIAILPARGQAGAQTLPSGAAAQTALPLLKNMRDALGRFRDAGGISAPGMTGKQRLNAAALESIPLYERVTNPAGYSARQDLQRLATEGVFSLLPLMAPNIKVGSRNFDTEKEFKRLSDSILNAKDYNSALRGIQSLEDLVKAGTSQSATPSRAARSPAAGGWGKATVVGR